MNPTELIKYEALRYLGYKKESLQRVDLKTLNLLAEAAEDIKLLNSFKYAFKTFAICITADNLTISNSDIAFKSASLSQFLANCRQAVFFTATLGAVVDRFIASLSRLNMEKALIYDAFASAYIDHKCDEAQKSILNDEFSNRSRMSRFSPGYGDLDLKYNGVIIDLVNAQKEIGLTSTESHMLIPQKSIVAIWGLNCENNSNALQKCEKCGYANDCNYKI